MSTISVRDARALLEVAATIEYDPSRGAFGEAGLAGLCELLGADWVCYCERHTAEPRHTVTSEVETRPFAGNNDELEAIFWSLHPQYTLGWSPAPDQGVVLIGDVETARAWRRNAFYNEWCREVHLEPQARVVLSEPGSCVSRTIMIDLADDAGWSFGERERRLLKLIRPAFLRPVEAADELAARQRALGLTERELEVLGLVRDGLTNGEIATQLVVSPATIRSHLENAFAKLGAHTRTEAIARLGEITSAVRPGQRRRAPATLIA